MRLQCPHSYLMPLQKQTLNQHVYFIASLFSFDTKRKSPYPLPAAKHPVVKYAVLEH